jgi:hypothetical protein
MDGKLMEATINTETSKPERKGPTRSQRRTLAYQRSKAEIKTLEELSKILLQLLDEATMPTVTPQDKVRLRRVMENVKESLSPAAKPKTGDEPQQKGAPE